MATRCVIGFPHGDGFKGRYCHWDGYPMAKVKDLATLVARDGLETVLNTITQDHYGWSNIDAESDGRLNQGYQDGRFVGVPGYGVAYTTNDNQSSPEDWITNDSDDWGTEYAYTLSKIGIGVFENDNGTWKLTNVIPWTLIDPEG